MTTLDRFLDNHPAVNRGGSQELTRAIWGGISSEYDTLKGAIKVVSSDSATLENIGGDMLDEVVMRFVGIQRVVNESDASRLKLMNAFFRRSDQLSWATKHSIKGAFACYFPAETINILENAVETNAVLDGDFEAFESGVKTEPFGSWSPSGSSIEVEQQQAFHGVKNVKGTGTGVVSQSVSATSGASVFSIAYRGALVVKIQRTSDSKYWNFLTKQWVDGETTLSLSNTAERYEIIERPVFLDAIDTVIFSFSLNSGSGSDFRIDDVSFGPKPSYPFIRVFVTTECVTGEYLNNWPGAADPVADTDYANATFLNQDYISGEGGGIPSTFYQTILDYIKTAGIKAIFMFMGRG